MMGDELPLFREINFVGEGKLRELFGDLVEIPLGNPEKLGDFTGEFWSSNWRFLLY